MLEEHIVSALIFVAIAGALSLARKRWASRHPPFPPGPKGYPIIGNLLDFPENPIWEGLTKMAQEHDTDILHLDMMGSHLVVFSNSDAAAELEQGRSALYSNRPRFPMVSELMGCSWAFSLMPYGDAWRKNRKLFHRFFNITAVKQYDEKIYEAMNVFLNRLSESPERFLKHVHFLTGSLSLSVAYGLNVESEDDKFYSASKNATSAVDLALVPGAFLVDFLPILKYIPEWFPGAGFKKFARVAKQGIDNSITLPFQHVKGSLQANVATAPSLVSTCLKGLSDLNDDGVDEEMIRSVGGIVYLGGEDTTAAAIKSFFLAVTLYPETVRLAQKELDSVIGRDHLPDFSDQPRLPYISALVKEVLRWRPPTPFAATHRTVEDDVFKGLFIPAGTTTMGNTWAMFRDESVYPNAHIFNPGRFLKDGQIDPNVKDPEKLVFGWGRRICPGRHFALRVVWLTVACVLAKFDISKCLDEYGRPIVPEEKYTFGGITHPLPFKSDIKPRSVPTSLQDSR